METNDGFRQESYPLLREPFRIPLLDGRPDRDAIIGSDDLADLRIALNTTASLEEFLSLV